MPSQPAGSDKLAVPARKSQDEMVRQFDEVYHFTQERTPAQKTELANRLFELGKKSQGGPVEKFVFFREAIELGTGGGAVDLVLQVVDAIAAEFNIDALDVKQKVMTGLAATTGDAAGVRSFIEHADALVDGALAESRYDLAVNLAQAAHDVSQKPAGKDLRRHTFERRSEVQQLAASWEQLRTVQSALKVNPEEPNANLQMGRWYCLKQGNWERGLAHLAKSADPTLRQLAAQELQSPPTDPAEQVKLADGWWAISDAAADADKIALRRHAGQWYLKAAPGLPEGFAKDKVVNRLAEIAKSEHAAAAVAPGVPAAAATPAPAGEKPAVSADTAKLGREVSIDLGGGVKMEFVLIPAGVFVMGDEKGKDHERPPHNVTLTRSFYLGKCEVSQEQWRAVMGNNPSKFDGLKNPVENVSWEDCQTFLKKLNEKFGKGSVKFSLPTEAEWEYSCRAGSTTRWCFGDDPAMIGNYAWFAENSAGKTQPVGQKKPNVWGLYDMHGNVVEWCADNYDKDYYRGSPPVDPPGPASSDWRVVRGGSFNFSADGQRSAWRGTGWPTDRFNDYGFRVLRVVTVP
jgi:formylglycine-generating enzyme required for sulfatase activity